MSSHRRPQKAAATDLKPLLDSEGAALFLGKSTRTVTRLVGLGLIPHLELPGTRGLRFRPEALAELARQLEVPASPQIGGAD